MTDSENTQENPKPAITVLVPEMDCPVEAGEIREALALHPEFPEGIYDTARRTITFGADRAMAPDIIAAIRATGFEARLSVKREAEIFKSDIPWAKLSAALAAALLSEFLPGLLGAAGIGVSPLFSFFSHGVTGGELSGAAVSLLAIALAGTGTLKRGALSLARFRFNMASLMAAAVTGAFLTGAWSEAAVVMALFEISEGIEQLCLERSRNAVKSLLSIVPKTAAVFRNGDWTEVPADGVLPGERVRVLAGERISLDGTVLEGESETDESMMTGEPVFAKKAPGDPVLAGTVNQTGVLVVRVTSPASDSAAARIIASIEEAEQKKAPVQRFVDRFAFYYTPAVLAAALLTAVLPPLFGFGGWSGWFYKGLVLLVIGCPCALVVSTPVTIISALVCAAREGVVIKGGASLETGRKLSVAAFDKTGTITLGRPECSDVIPVSAGVSAESALRMASSLSRLSDHPVSKAVTRRAEAAASLGVPAKNLTNSAGSGLAGTVNGARLSLVSPSCVKKMSEKAASAVAKLQSEGKSVSVLTDLFGVSAVFGITDRVKPGIRETVASLEKLGITPWILTGDNSRAAEMAASAAGIPKERVLPGLKPGEKLEAVEKLKASGVTAMAGDGINDAPALAASDIGIVMGIRGSDAAVEASDVMLMDDNLEKIPFFKALSRITYRFLAANIAFAVAVKFVFAALDFAGLATMWMAVFADTGVTLLVVMNGMRLLRAAPAARREAGLSVN